MRHRNSAIFSFIRSRTSHKDAKTQSDTKETIRRRLGVNFVP